MILHPKLKAALRVTGALSVVVFALGSLGVRHAQARLGEAVFDVSATFLGPVNADQRPRLLSLNGLQFQVTSRTLNEGLDDVLERFERACRGRTVTLPTGAISPTLRLRGTSEGAIACVDTGGNIEWAEFWKRLDAVAETGDLARLGDVRYLYASERSGKTTTLLVASNGTLPVRSAFPKAGDAPGIDVGPRPEGTTRILSAFEQGHPYAIAAYRAEPGVEWSAEKLRVFLRGKGFSIESADGRWLIARREGETFVVTQRGTREKGTTVTVMRLEG